MVTLVTGGTGFVGANIVRDLARNGHQVVSFDINGPDHLLQDFLGGGMVKMRWPRKLPCSGATQRDS